MGCSPPSSTPSSLLEDSLTGDWMRVLIQMAARVGKGVYRHQRGLPGVLQAPLDPGLGHPPQCLPSAPRWPFTGMVPSWHPEVSKAF
jgi:hypothetical protein